MQKKNDLYQELGKLGFCKALHEDDLVKMFNECQRIELAEEEILFEEGSMRPAMFIILSGKILIFKKNKVLDMRMPGQFFGEMSIIDSQPRSASAKAICKTTLLEIDPVQFEAHIASNPEALMALLKTLVRRTRGDLNALDKGYLKLKNQITISSNLNTILDDSTNEIYAFHPDDLSVVQMNLRARENLGYQEKEIKGLSPLDFIFDLNRDEFLDMLRPLFNGEKTLLVHEGEHKRCDGSIYPVEMKIQMLDNEGEPFIVVILENLTERKRMEGKVRYMAYYDLLTDLPNKNLVHEKLGAAFEKAKIEGHASAVLLIGLDGLKSVNDFLGHEAGDLLLKEVAKRLKNSFRQKDEVARLESDEFVLIMSGIKNKSNIHVIGKKILQNVGDMYHLMGQDVHLTCSIGIALFPKDGNNPSDLLQNANLALSYAKESGKNRYHFYDAAMQSKAEKKIKFITGIRKSLDSEEFILCYQPKYNMKTGKIVGAEALIRWKHPTMGQISPGLFIPIAEESHLILPMGDWVLKKACEQLKKWHEMGYEDFSLAVNVSSRQFAQKTIIPSIVNIIRESGVVPSKVELELTESILIGNWEDTAYKLNLLDRIGIKVSIDDFGTGYSSLKYLKDLNINCLKIDRCFVKDFRSKTTAAIIQSVIAIAKAMGLVTIAEGIETEEEKQFLLDKDCDIAQGFLYCKPVPADELTKILEENTLKLNNKNDGLCIR